MPANKIYIYILCVITLLNSASCSSSSSSDIKFKQYYLKGEALYKKNCTNCHQQDGKGLGLLYPPLAASDFMMRNKDKVLCIIKYGSAGELSVNNKSYNQSMPGFPDLSSLEVAQIATYIYNTWNNKEGVMEVKEVAQTLSACP